MSGRKKAIIVVIVCLVLVGCSEPHPAGLAFSYLVGGCAEELESTRSMGGGEVEITVEDGLIHVEQQLTYVCCAELKLTVEQEGNTLRVIEANAGEICRCLCEYQVQAEIADLDPGTYEVQVWGVQYRDLHPLELLGEATVTL